MSSETEIDAPAGLPPPDSTASIANVSAGVSQHVVDESEARQKRKIAAALRQPPQQDAIDVNVGDDAVLLQSLMRIRKLPTSVAKRIVNLRPFTSRTDLVLRVNAGCGSKRDRLGPAFVPVLRVEGAHAIAFQSMIAEMW